MLSSAHSICSVDQFGVSVVDILVLHFSFISQLINLHVYEVFVQILVSCGTSGGTTILSLLSVRGRLSQRIAEKKQTEVEILRAFLALYPRAFAQREQATTIGTND